METTQLYKREHPVEGQPEDLYDGQGDINTSTVLHSVGDKDWAAEAKGSAAH